MKHFLTIFLICIFLSACATNPIENAEDLKQPEEVTVKYLQTSAYNSGARMIGDVPVYSYVGEKDFSDENVFRRYNLWENRSEGKYIMIYHIILKKGEFSKDVKWVNREYAIFVDGMRSVYTSISKRPWSVLQYYNAELADCIMLVQEAHINDDNNEAILRILIVPDEDCNQDFWNPVNELDRVTITNPLGKG